MNFRVPYWRRSSTAFAAGFVALVGLSPAPAADVALELVVPDAEEDRTDAVVRLPLVIKGEVWDGVEVKDATGKKYPAQIAPPSV